MSKPLESVLQQLSQNFENGHINEMLFSDAVEIALIKGGKPAQIGEIRTFGNKRYQKHLRKGWIPAKINPNSLNFKILGTSDDGGIFLKDAAGKIHKRFESELGDIGLSSSDIPDIENETGTQIYPAGTRVRSAHTYLGCSDNTHYVLLNDPTNPRVITFTDSQFQDIYGK